MQRAGSISGETGRLATFAILAAAALLPILTTRIPAMVDYPNHLARMFVIARGGTPFYHVAWALYPNLAMDLVVPELGRFIGIELATRAFLLASDLLILSGAAAIEFVIKRRVEFSGFAAVLALYSLPFAWGFVNFEFGLGLALWGMAGWIALGERAPAWRLLLHVSTVAALFVSHLFALGLYGFALGVHELWLAYERGWTPRQVLFRAWPFGLPFVVAFLALRIAGGTVGQDGTGWSFMAKPLWFVGILNGCNLWVSAGSVTVLCVLVAGLARRGALRFEASGAWLATGFGLLYVAMPFRLFDTAFVDMRVLTAALLVLPAFVRATLPDRLTSLATQAILSGVVLINMIVVLATWRSYAPTYDALIKSFDQLQKGSRVLVADSGDAPDPPLADLAQYPMYNAPTLAVHFADALVPTFFTSVGKQPVAVDAAHRHLTADYGGPVPRNLLVKIAQGQVPPDTPSFVRSWPKDFDYVYVVGERSPNPLPGLLSPVGGDARFKLYRVSKEPANAGTRPSP